MQNSLEQLFYRSPQDNCLYLLAHQHKTNLQTTKENLHTSHGSWIIKYLDSENTVSCMVRKQYFIGEPMLFKLIRRLIFYLESVMILLPSSAGVVWGCVVKNLVRLNLTSATKIVNIVKQWDTNTKTLITVWNKKA